MPCDCYFGKPIFVAADSLRKFSSGPCRNDGANAWEGGVAPAVERVENLGQPLVTYSYSWLVVIISYKVIKYYI